MNVNEEKQFLREKIWRLMTEKNVARFPLPCWGRIPNFVGAEAAAEKLRQLKEWKNAKTIFVNPDAPQRKVRENALKDGKNLVVASPKLEKGFFLINPLKVKGKESYASTIKGIFHFGAETHSFLKPDLVVEGSVAVDLMGHRLGKGHGYGDVEIRMLRKMFGELIIATTVHDLQVVEKVPFSEKDEKISIIVTPTRIIYV